MFRNPIVDAVVVLLIVLLFFGPKRLPELGKSLGSGLKEFKDGITGGSGDSDDDRAALTRASDETPLTRTSDEGGADAAPSGPGGTQIGAERRP